MYSGKRKLLLASSLYNGIQDTRLRYVMTILQDEEADPNTILPDHGISPFHLAVGNGSEEFAENVTKVLLQYGASPNVRSVEGVTPVHIASAWGRTRLLELLLFSGGDPWLEDNEMKNAFHYANEEHHWNTLQLLERFHRLDNVKTDDWSDLCDPNPKYKLTLDKVMLYNRDVVLQYAADSKLVSPTKTVLRSMWTQTSPNYDVSMGTGGTQRNRSLSKHDKEAAALKSALPMSTQSTSRATPPRFGSYMVKAEVNKYNSVVADLNNKQNVTLRRGTKRNFPLPPKRSLEKPPEPTSLSFIEELKERQAAGLKQHLSQMCEVATETMVVDDEVMVEVTPKRWDEDNESIKSATSNDSDCVIIDEPFDKSINACNNLPEYIVATTHDEDMFNRDLLSQSNDLPAVNNCNVEMVESFPDFEVENISVKRYLHDGINKENYSNKKSAVTDLPNVTFVINTIEKMVSEVEKMNTETSVNCESLNNRDVEEESQLPLVCHCDHSCLKNAVTNLSSSVPEEVFIRDDSQISNGSKDIYFPNLLVSDNTSGDNCVLDLNAVCSISGVEELSCSNIQEDCSQQQIVISQALHDENEMYDSEPQEDSYLDTLNKGSNDLCNMSQIGKCVLDSSYSAPDKTEIDQETREQGTGNILVEYEPPKVAKLVRYKTLIDLDRFDQLRLINQEIGEKLDGWGLARDGNEMVICKPENDKEIIDQMSLNKGVPDLKGSSQEIQLVNATPHDSETPCTDVVQFRNESTRSDIQVFKESCGLSTDSSLPYISCNEETENKVLEESFDIKYSFERKKSLCPTDTGDKCEVGTKSRSDESSASAPFSGDANDKSAIATKMHQKDESCSSFPSSSGSYASATEDYLYTDDEQGIVLLERRFLVPQSDTSEPELTGESSMDSSVASYDTDTLLEELKKRGLNPGPIIPSTKRVYIKKLERLARESPLNIGKPTYSPELERTLRVENWLLDLSPYERLEVEIAAQFAAPDPTRRWREGVLKSSFCYLLLDPRITCNLPCRVNRSSPMKLWPSFLESIFYVGKGKRSRPYSHLYQAAAVWKSSASSSDPKIQQILDIWKNGLGVVCLHIFLNVIPVEAYTREASMIDALTLRNVRNARLSEYYGVAATWPTHLKNMLGVYLLYKAMGIFINEGERQLRPADLV